jgi:hypothetical protein
VYGAQGAEAAGREHNVGGWLYRVAVNLGYNALRAARRRTVYEQAADRQVAADPEAVAEQREERLRGVGACTVEREGLPQGRLETPAKARLGHSQEARGNLLAADFNQEWQGSRIFHAG